MIVYYQLNKIRKFRHPVVALGTFDGVHRGHRKLISTAVAIANKYHGTSLVLTFDHIPREILKKNVANVLLTTTEQKIKLIGELGASVVTVLKFDRRLARMSAEKFVRRILVGQLGVKVLVVGENYRFGAGQSGTVELLKKLGALLDFRVLIVPALKQGGHKISSTVIRELLRAGKLGEANKLLGRSLSLTGIVSRGGHFATDIGFPTANLVPDDRILLPDGVFAGRVGLGKKVYGAAINIGTRPTLRGRNGRHRVLEAHLLTFRGNIYGRPITVYLEQKIRSERFFPDLGDLAAQIKRDISVAGRLLKKR